jgi:hypothetical protein
MSIGELSIILLVGMANRPVLLVSVVLVLMGRRRWLVVCRGVENWISSLSIEVLRRRFAFVVVGYCLASERGLSMGGLEGVGLMC